MQKAINKDERSGGTIKEEVKRSLFKKKSSANVKGRTGEG
jgi:hypothetical protein